jgi:hypothetical protein
VWRESTREWKEKQKKTDNMKRIKQDTTVINAVPEGKQSLVGRSFWNLRNIKTGTDKSTALDVCAINMLSVSDWAVRKHGSG